jgi:hypothetical protein
LTRKGRTVYLASLEVNLDYCLWKLTECEVLMLGYYVVPRNQAETRFYRVKSAQTGLRCPLRNSFSLNCLNQWLTLARFSSEKVSALINLFGTHCRSRVSSLEPE